MKRLLSACVVSIAALACGDSFTTIIVEGAGGQTASGGQGGGDVGGNGGGNVGGNGGGNVGGNVGGMGGGDAGAPVCPANGTSHVTDDFENGTFEPLWETWAIDAQISESGGTADIVFTPGIYSEAGASTLLSYDLRSCDVVLEIVEVPNSNESIGAHFYVHDGGGSAAEIDFDDGGFIEFRAATNGTAEKPEVSLPFNHTQHRWWRIAERNGNTFLQTSPDAAAWDTRFSFPTRPWAASVKIEFYGASAAANTAPGAFRVDNLNLTP